MSIDLLFQHKKILRQVKIIKNEEILKPWSIVGKDSGGEHVVDKESFILLPSDPEKIRKTIAKWLFEEYCFLWDVR